MRCISYHVAFGCIHCIRDALYIFRNAYECITHAYTCIHTVHCMHFQTALQHTTAYGYIRCAAYDCIRKGVLHTLHTRRIQRFQKCSVCVSYAVYAAECNMVRNETHYGKYKSHTPRHTTLYAPMPNDCTRCTALWLCSMYVISSPIYQHTTVQL